LKLLEIEGFLSGLVKIGAYTPAENFSTAGVPVANLTGKMKKLLPLLLLSVSLPAAAQNWSVGAGSGPFLFGDFVKRTFRIGNEVTELQTSVLSASTRAGLSLDLERRLSDRFAIRAEGAFTRAPIGIKREDVDETVPTDAGDIDVTTLSLPLVFRINPSGTIRFHIHGGPAHAAYRISRRENATSNLGGFRGTRTQWGWAAGAGAGWYFSDRFAIEAQGTNINTGSPFREDEVAGAGRVEIPRSNNLHTTIGFRYWF